MKCQHLKLFSKTKIHERTKLNSIGEQVPPDDGEPETALPTPPPTNDAKAFASRATSEKRSLPILGEMIFPQYQAPKNPTGIPVADYSQSKLLMKAIKVFGRPKLRAPKSKTGLISKDTIAIKRKKPRFY